MNTSKKLKVLKLSDSVRIVFGVYFDESWGNTYHDAEVSINGKTTLVQSQYGSHYFHTQGINEALSSAGYRVRMNKGDYHRPFKHIHTEKVRKLKRDLFSTTEAL